MTTNLSNAPQLTPEQQKAVLVEQFATALCWNEASVRATAPVMDLINQFSQTQSALERCENQKEIYRQETHRWKEALEQDEGPPISVLCPTRDELQVKCAKLEAACAERGVLLKKFFDGVNDATDGRWKGPFPIPDCIETMAKTDKALSVTCGQPLLDRMERYAKALESRPKIVCICGSSRFVQQCAVKAWELNKQGVGTFFMPTLPEWYPGVQEHHQAESEGMAKNLDDLWLRLIDMADEVFVMNCGGYIGEQTAIEIEHAIKAGKPVRYEISREALKETK